MYNPLLGWMCLLDLFDVFSGSRVITILSVLRANTPVNKDECCMRVCLVYIMLAQSELMKSRIKTHISDYP